MRVIESWVLGYLLNSVWQVPLVFAAAWSAARLVRRMGPRMEHRVWVSALLLEAVLPGCQLRLGELCREVLGFVLRTWRGGLAGGETRIAIGPGAASGTGLLRIPADALVAVTVVYLLTLLYFAGRLGWGLWRTNAMQRQAQPVTLPNGAAQQWHRCAGVFAIRPGTVKMATSPMVSGPVTVGIWKQVLLVPPGFLEAVPQNDLAAMLAHEFAHLRRQDFARNLLFRVISLPASYHPALWLTASGLAETREMLCDRMAADAVDGPDSYARSLLRLASMLANPMPAKTLHAIGIFDANIIERRLMNLTRKPVEIRGASRLAIALACGVIALATCASALALRMEVSAPAAQNPAPKQVHVNINNLKVVHKIPPVYPVEAKAPGKAINGVVSLEVVIGKDGAAENIRVKKSLRGDYDANALEAVRQWRWQPYLLNGDPIEVVTTVNITYSLVK